MISIVTAYYNRKELFYRTLLKLRHTSVTDFEVIAVDDGSNEENRLESLESEFPFLRVIRLDREKKWYRNPCIPFNIGFQAAAGDIVILQNPECMHLGDVLKYVRDNLRPNDYLSLACYSLDKPTTNKLGEIDLRDEQILSHVTFKQQIVRFDGDDGWYNHPVHRPVGYHFCSAIFKKDLEDLGGFDERYAAGIAYDDLEFLYRVKKKKMKLKIIGQPMVLHQHHYAPNLSKVHSSVTDDAGIKLLKRNELMFEYVTRPSNSWRANILNIDHGYKTQRSLRSFIYTVLRRVKKKFKTP